MNWFCFLFFFTIITTVDGQSNEESLLPNQDGKPTTIEPTSSTTTQHSVRTTVPSLLSTNLPTNEDIQVALVKAKIEVDRLQNDFESQLFGEFQNTKFRHSTLSWHDLTSIDAYAKDRSYSALISVIASQKLKRDFNITNWSPVRLNQTAVNGICVKSPTIDCVPGKYRSTTGICNNVEHPQWGSTYAPFQRFTPISYSDGISQIRRSTTGSELRSPRIITRSIFGTNSSADKFCTLLLAQWGQFVLVDMSHIGTNKLMQNNKTLPLPCCGAKHPECLPIFADANDTTYEDRSHCIPYSRSVISPPSDCSLGPRQPANLATSFLDASSLYGNTRNDSHRLREFVGGRLRSQTPENDLELPPALHNSSGICVNNRSNRPCFDSATTAWSNLLPTAAVLHTIWLRNHNRVASRLQALNPHWTDERVFEETRRIVVAQLQHITVNEFLPLIIGREQVLRAKLTTQDDSNNDSYDIKTNPTTLDEYAVAAGFFFTALRPDTLSESNGTNDRQHLSALFGNPEPLYEADGIKTITRGLLQDAIVQPDLRLSAGMLERFVRGPDVNGLDLAALIVQMGRDHGLASYTSVREHCGLSRPHSFDDLKTLLRNSKDVQKLKHVYETVDDCDLFTVGLAEQPERGALLGPTFTCIIKEQFVRVKRGDRFWYTNDDLGTSGFTSEQLQEIRKTTFASLVCDNVKNIGLVQPRAFELPDDATNCPVLCNSSTIPQIEFNAWADVESSLRLPITQETVEKALRMGAEQYRRFLQVEQKRLADNPLAKPSESNVTHAIVAHARYAAPKPEALDRAHVAGILRETTNILLSGDGLEEHERLPSNLDVETLHRLLPTVDVGRVIGYYEDYVEEQANARAVCLPRPLPCDRTSRYRTITGWCNNLRNPKLGNAFEPMRRIQSPAYDDDFDTPRARSISGRPLPSARTISIHVHNDDHNEDIHYSHMLMQFGQLLDHDLTHSPLSRGPGNRILNCSTCDTPQTLSIHCFPIPVPEDDPYFPPRHTDGTPRCIPMARSILGQVTLGYRNQLNQLTAFIDVSHVYGSTDCETDALRLHRDGKLNFTSLPHNKQALPQGSQERLCHTNPKHSCFNAGDERNNIQPGLATVHTLMLREHNRLAEELQRLNPHWTDEKLFQEARRILIAQFQHITFSEFLPIIIGCELMSEHDLWPRKTGYAKDNYDPTCDPQMSQEFSMAAFRYGHTLIRNVFPRLDRNYNSSAFPPVELRENFNNATALYQPQHGHMESVLMGLMGSAEMQFNRHASNAVRNHLFQYLGGPYTGLDLIAVNIQRGRDHGMSAYNSYRESAGLKKATKFEDLSDTMNEESIRALAAVYEHVNDIDLFTGMMSERSLKGALVGPMVAHFLAEQFARLKRCDRFYYETDDSYLRFTAPQLTEIRKSTFGKMICENSDYAKKIQPNVFLQPNDLTNAPIFCNQMPTIDLSHWIERENCVVRNMTIEMGKTKRVSPCISCTCTSEGSECHSTPVVDCDDLLRDYSMDEIKKDTVCLIQCSTKLRRRN
ncbi:hypothetical protein M3Y95_00453300 [Aphelenchoides besseyi]|nr:hypothetical protein M3Y95_00453300 [Aphelenchoides besseyi]